MDQDYPDLQQAMKFYWRQYRGWIIVVLLIAVAFYGAATSFYVVAADSRGVVLRFGEFRARTLPGLHFKLPFPLERAYIVPVTKVQAVEFGYQTLEPGVRTRYAEQTASQKDMARMLTGDLNLADVEWVVQYRIREFEPENYLFNIGGLPGATAADNAREMIKNVSESVMRRIVGDVSVDSVITTGRGEIALQAQIEMQEMLDRFKSGMEIVAVKLQSATPPDPVKDAFDAVNRAKQNKERVVNDAKGQRNRVIPEARGKRDRAISEAEGYAIRIERTARGQTQAFLDKLAAYKEAPDVTKTRLYIEAMEVILAGVDEKVIIDDAIRGMLPLLNLDDHGPAAKGGAQ